MVGPAAAGSNRIGSFWHLLHLGGAAECALLRRALFVAVLFTVYRRQLRAQNAAFNRFMVDFIAGVSNSLDSRWLPRYLLLLSQGLLSIVLPFSAGLRRERRRP